MNLFGKVTSGLAVAALAGCAVQGSAGASARATAGGIWPAHTVLTLTSSELLAAVDPAADAAYEMAGADDGRFRLERADLATGAVRRGPAFPVAGLLPSAGYVWIYGRQFYPRGLATRRFAPSQVNSRRNVPPGRSGLETVSGEEFP